MDNHLEVEKWLKNQGLLFTQTGSRPFGFATEKSDYDYIIYKSQLDDDTPHVMQIVDHARQLASMGLTIRTNGYFDDEFILLERADKSGIDYDFLYAISSQVYIRAGLRHQRFIHTINTSPTKKNWYIGRRNSVGGSRAFYDAVREWGLDSNNFTKIEGEGNINW